MKRSHPCRGILVLVTAALAGLSGARAATTVNGIQYDGNGGPWTAAASPYVINADVTVPAGQTLTIEPGAIVKVAYGSYDLIVEGRLLADGTSSSPIVFTAYRDDSVGGDTNGDGNASAPFRNSWGGIRFKPTSAGSIMDHCDVRYAGWASPGAVWVEKSDLTLSNSVIQETGAPGVRVEGSDPVLSDNVYQNNSGAAVAMDLASDPQITGVTVSGNTINGLQVDSGTMSVDGSWDDPDIVCYLGGDITVAPGVTLTVAPGQIVKMAYGSIDLIVEGTLNAEGTAADPIVFTSERDDDRGGDTNNNGTVNTPYNGVWGGIVFTASSTASLMDHCEVRYGGWSRDGNITVSGGELTLTNSLLYGGGDYGVRIESSNPTLLNNEYTGCYDGAVSMDLASDPHISGVTVDDNGVNGLVLDSGTLSGSHAWDDPDIVYVLLGDVTVPAGATLTVAAGQVIKAGYGAIDLLVEGTLLAQGTSGQPVVFTHLRDDTIAGDTNNNGTTTMPSNGHWGGVRILASSTGSIMDHVVVRYGGWSNAGSVWVIGGELTMSDCTVSRASGNGVRVENSNPLITDISIDHCWGSAASMDLNSNPDIDGVTVNDNAINGMSLDSGTAGGDAFWDDPDMVYRLTGDVTVPAGITLTMAPGQIVKSVYGSVNVFVNGTLHAPGTAEAPIVFTSERDDTIGGDTNNNADANSPGRGNWDSVVLGEGSTDNLLQYVDIRYGGWSSAASLAITGAEATLANCTLQQSNHAGMRIEDSDPVITDITFSGNAWSAASMDLASNPHITGVTMDNNAMNCLTLDGGILDGDGFWDDADIVYRLSDDVTVPAGATLTVGPGQIIKSSYGSNTVVVQGTMLANGTAEAPIVFTSERDDSVGGDTNNNAAANSPGRGNWGGVVLGSGSSDNLLQYVDIRYGGWSAAASLVIEGAQATLSNCTLQESAHAGLRIENSDPVITAVTFIHNGWSAATMDLSSNPHITGVTMDNNASNSLTLDDGTLDGDGFWDDADIVYLLSGNVTVPADTTLTVGPGQIIKSNYGSNTVVVQGTMLANGTSAAPIVFTADRDDSVGGDTNNDGSSTSPREDIWGGLRFNPTSQDNRLDYADIRYGGWSSVAGIEAEGGHVELNNTRVIRCGSDGVRAWDGGRIDMLNCLLYKNTWSGVATLPGGVISAANCTIDAHDYGVYLDRGTVELTNTIVSGNSSAGIYTNSASSLTLNHCNVYNPSANYGNYRNTEDRTGKNGTISADPLYVDASAGDLRLQDGSPCIDAATSDGAPARDILGLLRYDHPDIANAEAGLRGYVDMGAFEYGGLTPLDIDLVTSHVAAPADGPQSGAMHLSWRVTNTGSEDATRAWYDAVYLSTDAVWSADDRLIGRLEHTGGLAAGASYDADMEVQMQGVIPGSLYVIIMADARYETLEGGERDNNAGTADGTTTFTMPQLVLGVPMAGSFDTPAQPQYYQVLVPTGSNLRVELDDLDDTGLNAVYLSHAAPPTVGSAQYASINAADHAVSVPAAAAGAWYVLVYNAFGTGDFTLLAEVTQLGLYSISPEALGNAADMVLTLSGAGFSASTEVTLVNGGGTEYTGTVEVDSYSQITTTFTAASVPAGAYSVHVRDSNTGEEAHLADGFTVLAGGEATLDVNLVLPSVLGYHQLATIYVEYANTGDLAMLAPLLTVTASQEGREAALITLDESIVSRGFWTDALPEGFSHSVQFLASGEAAGILQPGESGRVPIYYAGWLRPWDFSYPPVDWRVGVTESTNPTPIDWSSLKDTMQPDTMSGEAWDAVWQNVIATTGSTWGDYVTMLDRHAVYLGRLGYDVNSIQDLLGFQLMHADGMLSRTAVGEVLDEFFPGAGLALSFGRSFANSISGRYRLGWLGRGWTVPWDVTLTETDDGTVAIHLPDGGKRTFQPDIRGGYSSHPSDYGTLLDIGGGLFAVREKDGTVTAFDANGHLDYLQDTNGNRITCGYTDGKLTALTHSSGSVVTLTYTPAGLIHQVIDPNGKTNTFAYDDANQHLMSVTRDDGRTFQYRYVTGEGSAREHALAEITYPIGARRVLTYDAQGRLAGRRMNDDEEQIAVTYPSPGKVAVANALGETVIYYLNHRAKVVKTSNPYGQTLSAYYDHLGHVVGAEGPDGRAYQFEYDTRGNLVAITDPLAQKTTYTYESTSGRLRSASGPNGQTAEYSYDENGNLAEIRTDGAAERFVYYADGKLSAWTNRRGNVTLYSYDADGRLTERDHSISPDVDLAYNAHGQITSAADASGTTDLDWDEDGNLTKITYPDGYWLEYTYDDAGRIISRTDQSGHTVTYHFDATGRLAELTDGGGSPIVTYTYGSTGRLIEQSRGNGITTTYSHDQAGRLIGIVNRKADNSLLSQFSFEHNSRGQVTTETTPDGTWQYEYDGLNRLVSAVFDSTNPAIEDQALSYQYDAQGNRIKMLRNGAEVTYATNGRNQYTQVGDTTYTYDADGNLISAVSPGGTTTYTYDEANRLIQVESPSDTWTYAYDAFGNRTQVTLNGTATRTVYDPVSGLPVATYDAAATQLAAYDYGHGLARQTAGGQAYYYTFDRLGSTDRVTDPTGNPVNQYVYAPFGEILERTDGVTNPFTYVGLSGVTDESNGLYRMGARHYHPDLGRFTSVEPLRVPPWSLYTYCLNDPVNRIDPSGFSGKKPNDSLGGWIGSWRRQYSQMDALLDAEDRNDGGAAGEALEAMQNGRDEIAQNSDAVAARGISDWLWSLVKAPFETVLGPAGDVITVVETGQTIQEYSDAGFGPLPDGAPGGGRDGGGTGGGTSGSSGGASSGSSPGPGGIYTPSPGTGSGTTNGGGVTGNAASSWSDTPAPTPPGGATTTGDSGTTAERDPNEKNGPAGFGTANYLRPDALLAYRVDFENDPEATAPAQIVRIDDPLSTSFDWNSFELTEIGFGDTIISIPAGTKTFSTVRTITYLGEDLDIHIEVGIDLGTGLVEALFYTIDPATDLPPTVELGFLPPEDGTGRGQGHISYVVKAQPDLGTDTEIRNVATIIFGFGESIDTNQVDPHDPDAGTDPDKEALVTIDADGPSSSVNALTAFSPQDITVTWDGTDAGSGIATYDIYVQTDGGAFVLWRDDTTLTSAVYTGTGGHTYGFYSIATDGVGLREPDKTTAEASTTVMYSVTFTQGPGGALSGDLSQDVEPGKDTTPVSATASPGYHFNGWRREGLLYSTDNPLTIDNVSENVELTAVFAPVSLATDRVLPTCAEAGETIPVEVTLTRTDDDPFTAFTVSEQLPPGWTFESVSSVPAPDMGPTPGNSGTIVFVWSTVPDMPHTLVYHVNIDPAATPGTAVFDGNADYHNGTVGVTADPTTGDTSMQVGDCCVPHSADQNGNWTIEVSLEITRIIQFYNSGGYHCQDGTEDGYAPGTGDQTCEPHDADQNGNWTIEVSPEITRIIQFYNSGGYHCQDGTEDGYAPGTAGPDKAASLSEGAVAANWANVTGPDTPEGMVDVTVALDVETQTPLSALVLEMTLPEGWALLEARSGDQPELEAAVDSQGKLIMAWVTPGDKPILVHTFRLASAAKRPAVLEARVLYRLAAEEVAVPLQTLHVVAE